MSHEPELMRVHLSLPHRTPLDARERLVFLCPPLPPFACSFPCSRWQSEACLRFSFSSEVESGQHVRSLPLSLTETMTLGVDSPRGTGAVFWDVGSLRLRGFESYFVVSFVAVTTLGA
jgi:hypothetical protein